MGNRKYNASNRTKTSDGGAFETPSIPVQTDQVRRTKLEDAFLKLCGVRKEHLLRTDKFLDEDRVFNLDQVCRWVRSRVIPRDADAIQTIIQKIPTTPAGCRKLKLPASDISLLATIAKRIPDEVLFTILDNQAFMPPDIDKYLARHPKETIRLPGEVNAKTWDELNAYETDTFNKLENLQQLGEGGFLNSLEAAIIHVRYREHVLNIPDCCLVGRLESNRGLHNLQGNGIRKVLKSTSLEPCPRLNTKEIQELYDFCKDTPMTYAITRGQGTHWLPLTIDMEALEFQQGLEDLKAEAPLEVWKSSPPIPDPSQQVVPSGRRKHGPANPVKEIWDCLNESGPANGPAVNFADPELKLAVDGVKCKERAHLFEQWIEEYPPGITDELVLSTRSVTDLFKNVGRKLREAEDNFRRTNGGNEPITIKGTEAVAIYRSQILLGNRLSYTERKIRALEEKLATRKTMIRGLTHLYLMYQKKVQELMWITSTKKFYLYGDALKNQRAGGEELCKLKVHYELQTNKLELLQEEMNLLAAMNCASQHRIETLEDVTGKIGGPCSHHDSPLKPDSMDWQAFQKDIEARKQATYRGIKKSVASQIEAQSLKGTQDWEFLELLFDHVLETDRKKVEKFVEKVYGSCVEILPKDSTPGGSCKEFLSRLDGREEPDRNLKEDLCLATGWRTYLPPSMTDCSNHEAKWVPTYEIEVVQEELDEILKENGNLIDELEESQRIGELAIAEAKKWREHYDFHLFNSKQQFIKADATVARFREWMDETLELFLASDEQQISPLQPEKDKLTLITTGIRTTFKERDDALRKNEPLFRKVELKDKIIDEKTREVARALELRSTREEALIEKNTTLESTLKSKYLDLEKARKDVDKVKEDWAKKIQRGHDKIASLEGKLKSNENEFNTMKLDYEVHPNSAGDFEKGLDKMQGADKETWSRVSSHEEGARRVKICTIVTQDKWPGRA